MDPNVNDARITELQLVVHPIMHPGGPGYFRNRRIRGRLSIRSIVIHHTSDNTPFLYDQIAMLCDKLQKLLMVAVS